MNTSHPKAWPTFAPAAIALLASRSFAAGTASSIPTSPHGLSVGIRLALASVAWVAGSFLAAWAIGVLWDRLLLPMARRTRTRLDVLMFEATRFPIQATVFSAGFALGVKALAVRFPEGAASFYWKVLDGVVYVLVVLSVTLTAFAVSRAVLDWYAEDIAGRASSKLHGQFATIGRKVSKFIFLFLALTVIFEHFGIRVTGLLATAGVASLAVALAAQETLSNMIAGFVLLADQPFRPGDRVELANGKVGDVLEVGLRTTRLLSFDHTVISIPNAEIAKNQIINYNAPNPKFKIRRRIGVAYGTDIRKAKRVLLEILQRHPEVLKDPPPDVFFEDFGESALHLLYVCWVSDHRDQFRIRDQINMAIKDRFEAEGIEIPFPQRVVHWAPRRTAQREPEGSFSLPPSPECGRERNPQ